MKLRLLSATLVAASIVISPLAVALSFDSVKKSAGDMLSGQSAQGTSSASGTSLLSSLGSGSFDLGSLQNVAGVLGYCQEQGYTASATDQVKEQLMEKLGGESQAEQSQGYQQGLSGLLQGDDGQTFNLSNLKDQVGERVCGAIADRAASSFLGG
ncbi:DUF2501 domain-containing protein [Salinicola peritrichatus]|uniref:DUF2501 domain-containing protein n=1 Tax=Salinicola peritrichatus TaxID=1267424 RepID=UPI0013A5F2DE|nr:DUF2501 domain-containing protein [Salinicola peritrichatus]